jgi:tetratricopeptide (TPR) repeat protein
LANKSSTCISKHAYFDRLLERTNQWGQAEINLGSLAKLNTDTGDFHFAANAHLRRGQAQLRAGFPKRANESFLTALKIIKQNEGKTPPYRVHLRLLNYQALVLRAKGELPKALDKLKNESLPMANDHCSRAAFASVINRIALVECELKDFASAYSHILEAIRIRLKFNMRSEAVRSLLILGTIHEGNGEQEKELFVWELALRWQQYLGDDESMPEALFRIGSLYMKLMTANSEKKITTIELTLRRFSGLPEFDLLEPIAKETGFEGIQVKASGLRQSARNAFVRCTDVEERLGQGTYTDRANELLRGL